MSKKLTVALAQMAPNSEVMEENVERIIKLIDTAANQGAEIISFPELALTPFFAVKNTRYIEEYFISQDDIAIQTIKAKSKEKNISVILGYAEKTNRRYYNSAMAISSNGEIAGNYRKMHLPGALIDDGVGNFEKIYFAPGDSGCSVINLGIAKVGLQICYDRHFPEGYRALALSGADIIFNLTAASSYGTEWRADTWELLLRARAFENGVFVAGINKIGLEYGKDYFGKSMLISPLGGKILATADEMTDDQIIQHVIDLAEINEANLRLPYNRDRREIDDYNLGKVDSEVRV